MTAKVSAKQTNKLLFPASSNLLNEKFCNVVFLVGSDDDIQEIPAIREIFAAHSKYFENMFFCCMAESLFEKNEHVIIEDVKPCAFQYIRDVMHVQKVSLNLEIAVHVLYAAQKYLMNEIVEECEKFIIGSIGTVSAFHFIVQRMNEYNENIFSDLFDLLVSRYSVDSVRAIISYKPIRHSLKLYQIKKLVQLSSNDECERYKFCFNCCQLIAWKTEEVKSNEVTVQGLMNSFLSEFDFLAMDETFLLTFVRSSNKLSRDELLDVLYSKINSKIKTEKGTFEIADFELSMYQLRNLKVNDIIDVRESNGHFSKCTILECNANGIQIHFNDWGSQYDRWLDFNSGEIFRYDQDWR